MERTREALGCGPAFGGTPERKRDSLRESERERERERGILLLDYLQIMDPQVKLSAFSLIIELLNPLYATQIISLC